MMDTFTIFSKLPIELRLMIWMECLRQEAETRLVILHNLHLRVIPFKKLQSPFFLTSKESRVCATKFSDVKLDIYRIPPPEPCLLLDLQEQYYTEASPNGSIDSSGEIMNAAEYRRSQLELDWPNNNEFDY
jgi:hypothetical protein